mmetsp:Transcript_106867/g.217988  ORF Transcript_106867/g.217988 Transcript_106867/m.217988 type:complete len:265 (-) Transcript_106867:804-1598(-)
MPPLEGAAATPCIAADDDCWPSRAATFRRRSSRSMVASCSMTRTRSASSTRILRWASQAASRSPTPSLASSMRVLVAARPAASALSCSWRVSTLRSMAASRSRASVVRRPSVSASSCLAASSLATNSAAPPSWSSSMRFSSFRMVMSWFLSDRNSTSYSATSRRSSMICSFSSLLLLLLAAADDLAACCSSIDFWSLASREVFSLETSSTFCVSAKICCCWPFSCSMAAASSPDGSWTSWSACVSLSKALSVALVRRVRLSISS